MATLVSAGVDVQIINESFYNSAGAGTVPLIVIATAANKVSPTGSGVALYTTTAMSGKVFPATSQREVLQAYGTPLFYSSQGSSLHGYELNEYGLHQVWQVMGVQNSALVLRADIDLAALVPSDSAPAGAPANGQHWFDVGASSFGVYRSNGNANVGAAWVSVSPKIATATDVDGTFAPKVTFGNNGDFVIVPQTTGNLLWEKVSGAWVKVGSTQWKAAHPTTVSSIVSPSAVTGTISINGTSLSAFSAANLTSIVAAITTAAIPGITAAVVANQLVITNSTGGDIVLANVTGTALATLGLTAGTKKGVSLTFTNNASFPAGSVANDMWIKMTEPAKGSKFVVKRYNNATAQWAVLPVPAYAFNSALADGAAGKDTAALAGFSASVAAGDLYVGYDAATGARELRRYDGAGFATLSYEASSTAPVSDPEAGALWFSTDYRVDVMIGNGQNWKGYKNSFVNTDPKGVIISGSAPKAQSDGTPLVSDDIWLDSSDEENYPALRRYDAVSGKWLLIDKTDQTTPNGIVFADARQDSGVAFTGQVATGYDYNSVEADDMLVSDFVDPDAPDARNYPAGTLLFNTRYATNNVKEWRPAHFVDGGFDPNTNYSEVSYTVGSNVFTFPKTDAGRWVTVSGNKIDGSPYMGRKAQRAMIVRSMQEAVASNDDIRAENVYYMLATAPGYPELLDELATLNRDQSEVSTLITDMPARLSPTAAIAWAQNANMAAENGEDGLTTAYEYAAAYYGWGLSTNYDGSNVAVPSSSLAIRAFLYNDRVGQPWFAPAGLQRGLVDNATSIGYISSENEFVPVNLNAGHRDNLYLNKINPITNENNALYVMGQKTLAASASALDRVQGVRLANYVKYHLNKDTRKFLFEQNDSSTRETATITVSRFFNGLMSLRAIEDYAVLCDETNNTPDRRMRHELWIDVWIKPIGAVEFVYIPVRFRDLDSDLG